MPERRRQSRWKRSSKAAIQKQRKEPGTASPAPNLLAFTVDAATGNVVTVETLDASGARRRVPVRQQKTLAREGRERLESVLEEAFEAFDDALIRLDGQIGWTYQLKEAEEGAFMTEPITARDDSYWFEKYGRLVRRAIDVWMRHVELVETIHTAQPDFDMLKDY